MKKIIFSGIILSLVFLVSCSSDDSKQFAKKVTVTADTTIMVPGETNVVTAPRWSCAGKRLPQPKLVAVENGPMSPVKVTTTKDTVITFGDDDAVLGGTGGGSSSSSNEGIGFLPELLKWLFAIIAVALTLWFLWWLLNNLPRRSTGSNGGSSNGGTNATAGNRNANAENLTHLAALATAVGNAGGGTVEHTTEDGMLFMKIGPDAPLVHVENSGAGSHSDGITVHLGDQHRTDIRPVFPVQKQEQKPADEGKEKRE